MSYTIDRNDATSRYELRDRDIVIGFAKFDLREGKILFTHTEVDSAFQGEGLGAQLADYALKDAASRGQTIVPVCPFIDNYLRTHDIEGAKVEWPPADQES